MKTLARISRRTIKSCIRAITRLNLYAITRRKRELLHIMAAAFWTVVPAPGTSQMHSPAILIGGRVMLTLDSIAALAWREELEPGACVTQWEQTRDTIRLLNIEPGDLAERHPGTLRWNGSMCGDSLPSMHGHILHLGHWTKPSPPDWILATDTVRKRAPFHLLLLIGTRGEMAGLIPYGVKVP